MDMTNRLIAAGIRPDCAQEIVEWYQHQGDDNSLELYVRSAEDWAARRKGCTA